MVSFSDECDFQSYLKKALNESDQFLHDADPHLEKYLTQEPFGMCQLLLDDWEGFGQVYIRELKVFLETDFKIKASELEILLENPDLNSRYHGRFGSMDYRTQDGKLKEEVAQFIQEVVEEPKLRITAAYALIQKIDENHGSPLKRSATCLINQFSTSQNTQVTSEGLFYSSFARKILKNYLKRPDLSIRYADSELN